MLLGTIWAISALRRRAYSAFGMWLGKRSSFYLDT
jgi:hypothetical protein